MNVSASLIPVGKHSLACCIPGPRDGRERQKELVSASLCSQFSLLLYEELRGDK